LVENSIRHGLKDIAHGGRIRIELRDKDHSLEISVQDNGRGISPEFIEKLGKGPVISMEGNGIGVYNVNQRLIGLFGEDSRLFIENKSEGGCRFSFSIPRTSIEKGEYAGENH
jgi:two-component system sensor histidine kinase LytS